MNRRLIILKCKSWVVIPIEAVWNNSPCPGRAVWAARKSHFSYCADLPLCYEIKMENHILKKSIDSPRKKVVKSFASSWRVFPGSGLRVVLIVPFGTVTPIGTTESKQGLEAAVSTMHQILPLWKSILRKRMPVWFHSFGPLQTPLNCCFSIPFYTWLLSFRGKVWSGYHILVLRHRLQSGHPRPQSSMKTCFPRPTCFKNQEIPSSIVHNSQKVEAN